MKLPLSPNSFAKSILQTPPDSPEKLPKKPKQKSACVTESFQRWTSENDSKLNPFFKILPQNRRKHNVSLFNFYVNKQPKKLHQNRKPQQPDQKQPKRYMQEENILRKKIRPALTSFSTQKLQILPCSSRQNFQSFVQKTEPAVQEPLRQKEFERNPNKINEGLVKNTKFDRKKFMYYRYRKKNSPQKNNNPTINQFQDKFEIHRLKPSKTLFNQVNIKTEEENKGFDQNGGNIEYRYTFFGVLPARNNSFSEPKCKLTIQPIPRQNSYKHVQRRAVYKTTREKTEKKQFQQRENKIFVQAIHFKPRKSANSKSRHRNQNPQKHKSQRKDDQIMGWNLDEELHMQQEQYF